MGAVGVGGAGMKVGGGGVGRGDGTGAKVGVGTGTKRVARAGVGSFFCPPPKVIPHNRTAATNTTAVRNIAFRLFAISNALQWLSASLLAGSSVN